MCAAKVMGLFKKHFVKDKTVTVPAWHSTPAKSATLVVYVPGDVSLFEDEHHHSHSSDIILPPAIPLAPDGEEGYANSQRLLATRDTTDEIYRESVCPPPNRTISDCESPPPYRCRSVGSIGQMERHSGGKSPLRLQNNANSSDSSGESIVRCYSLSNNNNKVPPVRDYVTLSSLPAANGPPSSAPPSTSSTTHHFPHAPPPYTSHQPPSSSPLYASQSFSPPNPPGATAATSPQSPRMAGSRTSGGGGGGGGGVVGHHSDPPPEYCDVIANRNVYNRHLRPSGNLGSGV